MEALDQGMQALMRDGMSADFIKFPLRQDTKPRAVWPEGLQHLEQISKSMPEPAPLWPFIVSVTYRRTDGAVETDRRVIERQLANVPAGEDLIPAGAELLRCAVFPASRFGDMSAEVRQRYAAEYRAYLMWRKAQALGKAVSELVPWLDTDPVHDDACVHRWVSGGLP